jgi:hypothetical protein
MTWFKIDDDFFFHPKVVAAGNAAIGLFVRCGSWASNHLTDGHIPHQVIAMFGTATDIDNLIDVGLLEETDTGYWMPAFLDYNPSADEVKAQKAATAERQRAHRNRRNDDLEDVTRESHVTNADVTRDSHVTNDDVTRESRVSHSAPTRPDPTRIKPPPPSSTTVDKAVDKVEVVVVEATRRIVNQRPNSRIKNWQAYLAATQKRIRTTHHDIAGLLTEHSLEHVIDLIVQRETGQTPTAPAKPPAAEHNPNCPNCAGSGWRTIDHRHNTVGRCDCTPSEHLAPVSELRRSL